MDVTPVVRWTDRPHLGRPKRSRPGELQPTTERGRTAPDSGGARYPGRHVLARGLGPEAKQFACRNERRRHLRPNERDYS